MDRKQVVTQADKNREKFRAQRDAMNDKRERWIDNMSSDDVLEELRKKKQPTFGTKQERIDRLKKAHGVTPSSNKPKKGNVLQEIERLKQNREERRKNMEEAKRNKMEREIENEMMGKNVDVDFEQMIAGHRQGTVKASMPHLKTQDVKINVCVRKRPIFAKEQANGELDCISCSNPLVYVHECKLKIDGISKHLENHTFQFDNTFGEGEDTDSLYRSSIQPLLDVLYNRGIVTCFAYGQTGSGKTFTMRGIQTQAITDLFQLSDTVFKEYGFEFYVSFFEIYGGKCFDLLNNKKKLAILEDANQKVQIQGLEERAVGSAQETIDIIEYANSVRTTHCTSSNDESSRSHAICKITLREPGSSRTHGQLLLVDLAGSERAQDCQSNNRQRRLEGAEINKSLLALKECIRALDSRGSGAHIPFRASKLTLVLRDSFKSKSTKTRIVMIACISPGSSSADHSLNTLRYSDRLKEKSDSSLNEYAKMLKQQEANPSGGAPQIRRDPGNLVAKPRNASGAAKPKVSAGKHNQNALYKQAQKISNELASIDKNSAEDYLSSLHTRDNPVGEDNSSSSDELDQDRDMDDGAGEARLHEKAKKDLQLLHNTIRKENNDNPNKMSQELLEFHQKVDKIMEEEEEILQMHMEAIKEDAQILTEEGEIISNVQGVGVLDYDIDDYVKRMEVLIQRKLKVYKDLYSKLQDFKADLQDEEQISHTVNTFYY
eukprot:CAMPEP_0115029864 /NCGR_PEP_ID=MMETSP0216-20121206/37323_1 /TAXON_ID=223996 /ORGANISM="Protocruzia adherens, Strain Boccale" /LENGTH=717 /DNA_ID=CAMNT_0002406667 /DNA_START=134 /DNA_END=2287 /DNA_ORIENTATION=-